MQTQRDTVVRDAHVIYELAYELRGATSLREAHALGCGWTPRTRAAAAVAYLLHEGFAELRRHRNPDVAELWLNLTNPAEALGWTRPPSA